jgi:hypothetical protein
VPRTCTICKHPQRAEIDAAIVGRKDLQDVAKLYDVSKYSVQRHQTHVVELIARSPAGEDFGNALSLVGSIIKLEQETDEIFQKAKLSKDHKTCLAAIDRKQSLLEFRAKVSGELKPRQTNILSVHVGGKDGLDAGLNQLLERSRFIPIERIAEDKGLPAPTGE